MTQHGRPAAAGQFSPTIRSRWSMSLRSPPPNEKANCTSYKATQRFWPRNNSAGLQSACRCAATTIRSSVAPAVVSFREARQPENRHVVQRHTDVTPSPPCQPHLPMAASYDPRPNDHRAFFFLLSAFVSTTEVQYQRTLSSDKSPISRNK